MTVVSAWAQQCVGHDSNGLAIIVLVTAVAFLAWALVLYVGAITGGRRR